LYAVVSAGFATRAVHPSGVALAQLRPAPVTLPDPLSVAVTANAFGSNFAVTYFAALIVTVQLAGAPATGLQPVQLLNTELASGVAVSVTVSYAALLPGFATAAVHPAVEPVVQLRPAPEIVPTPVPSVEALSANVLVSNFAETYFAPLIETVQLAGAPATGVQPVQLLKTELASGVAVNVTVVYAVVLPGFGTALTHPAEEPVVQLRPAPVMVPAPEPRRDALSAYVLGSNFTVTYFGPLTRREQVLGSARGVHPDQLFNTELASGVAVSVTVV
jgi:hypothetical protein